MKKHQVTLKICGKQLVFNVMAKNESEAKAKVINSLQIIDVIEIPEYDNNVEYLKNIFGMK